MNPLRSSNGHPSTASCVAKVWIPRSCRHDLDLHAAPHYACTASASWPTAAIWAHSPLLCAHVSISKSKKLTDPCAALQHSLYGTTLFVMASLEQHALVPPPSPPTTGRALRSPGCVRPVIPGTAPDWPYMMCVIPAWYTCSSKPRTTTSTQTSFARLHERRRALPPSRSVPTAFAAHGTILREDALARWP